MTPLHLYGQALRSAARGVCGRADLVDAAGARIAHIDPTLWIDLRPGDAGVLDRCLGSILDIGCGPGRLAAALAQAGRPALGVDLSAEAVRQARRRGAAVMHGDVFAPLPAEGHWRTVLLVDGNIGIGGDPQRLLHRCAGLLQRGGVVLAELRGPGERTWSGQVNLRYAGHVSTPFRWANVAIDDAEAVSRRAGLQMDGAWSEAGRWFAQLSV